jgi:membrane protein involved in colicin uptake
MCGARRPRAGQPATRPAQQAEVETEASSQAKRERLAARDARRSAHTSLQNANARRAPVNASQAYAEARENRPEAKIARAKNIVAEKRAAQQLEWAERILDTDGAGLGDQLQHAAVRNELKVDEDLRWRILARDLYRCQGCGVTGDTAALTIDHIYPVSLGGTNEESNLQTLCRSCNSRKGARLG